MASIIHHLPLLCKRLNRYLNIATADPSHLQKIMYQKIGVCKIWEHTNEQ
jgi:hypothetical protein